MSDFAQLTIVTAHDRDGDPIIAINPDDFGVLLAVTRIELGYYLQGQCPGYVSAIFSADQFRTLVTTLATWLAEVDEEMR